MSVQFKVANLFVAVMLACAVAKAQSARPVAVRTEHTKVSAVTHGTRTAPEPAPSPNAFSASRRQPHGLKPDTTRAAYEQPVQQGEVIMEGAPEYEAFDYGPSAPDVVETGESTLQGPACGTGCNVCGPDPVRVAFENIQLFGGVAAFKSPIDQGLNGNFGFHEGINWSGPIFEYGGIGGQVGFRAVQSDLAESYLFEDNRIQTFFTAGLFHRPLCGSGWQGGVAWDWLHDEFYGTMNVAQLRGEISWVGCSGHELGFWTALATTSDTGQNPNINGNFSWEPLDLYAMFYRRNMPNGGYGRFSAGATGTGQGLLGFDIFAPVSQKVSLVVAANYVIGKNDPRPQESLTEAWGLTIGFVWHPFYKNCCSSRNPYRPIFGVADNTSMILGYDGPRFD